MTKVTLNGRDFELRPCENPAQPCQGCVFYGVFAPLGSCDAQFCDMEDGNFYILKALPYGNTK